MNKLAKTTEGTETGIGKRSGSGKLFWAVGGMIVVLIAAGFGMQLMSGTGTSSGNDDSLGSAGSGDSGSGGSGPVSPAVVETPKGENTATTESFKSENWFAFYPTDSVQPQVFDLGDLKTEIYASTSFTVVTNSGTRDRFYMEYKFTLRNKKDSRVVAAEKCILERSGGMCSPGISLNNVNTPKEWEWSVEITKVTISPTQPGSKTGQPEKLKRTT